METGTPKDTPLRPYSPSSTDEHSSTLPEFVATASMRFSIFIADVQPEVLPLFKALNSEKKLAVIFSTSPISFSLRARGSPLNVILS